MKTKYFFLLAVIFTLSVATLSVFGQGSPNTLETNYYLQSGSELISPNGEYNLIYQEDGNLVLYGQNKKVIWASNSNNTGKPGKAIMQNDGNFVVYNKDEKPVWASETDKNGSNCIVQLNDNGEFEVIKKGEIEQVLYSSKNAGWGWNKPKTGGFGNWEYDMGFDVLQFENLDDKSDAELVKMYNNGEGTCGNCVAVERAVRYNMAGDYKNGFIWMEKAKYGGNELGLYYLASMYLKGQGTSKDYHKALSLYKELAGRYEGTEHIMGYRENSSNVQNRIAAFYYLGYGVDTDFGKVKSLLKKAIKNGSHAAQVNLDKYFKN